MKRIIAFLLVVVLCLPIFASCTLIKIEKPGETSETEEIVYDIDSAKAYLKNLYKDRATTTPADFEVVSKILIGGVSYDVTWTVDTDLITVEAGETKTVINVDEKATAELAYKLTATITAGNGDTATLVYEYTVPEYKLLSWEQYMAAATGDAVVVEGIVGAVRAKSEGSKYNEIFVQDATGVGAYYVYSFANGVDPVKDLGLKAGMTVNVTGVKEVFQTVTHEIKNATVVVLDSEIKTVAPVDITETYKAAEKLSDKALVDKLGMLVTIKGIVITGQSLADPNHQYYKFILGDKESYIRLYATSCFSGIGAEQIKSIAAGHTEHRDWSANVTGIVEQFNGAIYLNPVSTDCFEYLNKMERTDKEKIEIEIGDITIVDKVTEKTTIQLPLAGKTFTDVKFEWTSGDLKFNENGVAEILLEAEKRTITLKLTATLGNEKVEKTYTIEVDALATDLYIPKEVAAPVANTAYKFALYQATLGKYLYLNGEVSGRYLATTDKTADAVDVYAEAVEGGVKLYILVGEEKQYITLYNNAENKLSVKFDAAGTNVYAYNATTHAWETTFEGETYYLGTYNNFNTVSASKTSYINAENTGKTQFPAGLATLAPAAYVADEVAKPEASTAYKFGLYQTTLGKYLYLNGEVSGRYLGTTDKIDDAIDVYAENVEGGVKLYILVGEEKQYITLYNNAENKLSVKFDAAGTNVYAYNATTHAWETTFEGETYYLGTYNNFNTVSASKTSYINAENTGKTQFPANVYTMVLKEIGPVEVTAPKANTAYKFALYQTTLGKFLYLNGEVSGRYLATTDKISQAIDVYTEAVEGGVKLYILVGEEKQYITLYNNAENKLSVKFDAAGTNVYAYNATTHAWETTFEGETYYLGTYNNFNTVSASKTSYINAENTGKTQFPAVIASIEVIVEKEDTTTPDDGNGDNTGSGNNNDNTGSDDNTTTNTNVLAKFDLGTDGATGHADGSAIAVPKSYTNGNYTLTITEASKVYDGGKDETGKGALKLGTGDVIGSFKFTVGNDVNKVIFYVAMYKAKNTKVTVNDTTHTITTSSNSGSYTAIEVDTTSNKTVSFTTVSGNTRCMIDAIEFVG